MYSQTSIAICVLCKNPLESRAKRKVSSTKLCGKCCALIETIVPQATASSATPNHALQIAMPAQENAGAQALAGPQPAILADENLLVTREPQPLSGGSINEVTGNNGFHKPMFVQAEEDFAPVFQTANSELYLQDLPAPLPLTNGFETAQRPGDPEERSAPASAKEHLFTDEAETSGGGENFAPIAQPENFMVQETPSENGFYAASPSTPEINFDADNPIPNFPFLVEERKRKSWNAKARLGLAGVALLGCLVAGYFFIYRPFFGANENPPASKAGLTMTDDKSATKAMATGTEDAASAKLPDAKDVQGEAQKTADARQVVANPAVADGHAESAQFALQAGVFSTAANANKFAEQLQRAGIPTYVAPSKANKFRVLIGRFASLSEAQKYVPQAQAHANTVGLKLELLACEMNP